MDIDRRYLEHLNDAIESATDAWKANSEVIARLPVEGGKEALDRVEQLFIDVLEAEGNELRNKQDSIAKNPQDPDRKKVRERFNKLKRILCQKKS